jgi:ubiquinone/menaquinone biosynthesis C-methylase UbiE
MRKDREAIIQERFARQAKAFARSPLQKDPERLRRFLRFASPRRGERAIDVGCGPGIVVAALRGEGVEALGIDLTAEMLREARGAGGSYVRGDVARIPFRDGVFDLAVCRNTVHHLSDPPGVAREVARVLRPGGRMVIEDMQAPEDAARRAYHETIERLRDPAHARTLTAVEIRALLEGAGLGSIREEPTSFVIDVEEWMDRGYPAAAARREALRMLEACLEEDRAGLRVWREQGRLKFERRSLFAGGVKPV